jgi:hypothetical protein
MIHFGKLYRRDGCALARYDEWGNPVDAGLEVTFSATLGTIVFANLMTNERGEATPVLRAGNVPV